MDLQAKLVGEGYFVGAMHGDLTPRERKRVLNDCKALKYQYLVATDLAARGIDIEGVSHIINYELPMDYEFYLHRSGRTGRMHKDGIVYSLYEEIDDAYLDSLNKKKIKPSEINEDTKLEYYDKPIEIKSGRLMKVTSYTIEKTAKFIQNGNIDRVPIFLLNTPNIENVKEFLQYFDGIDISNYTKTCRAGIQFLKNRLENFVN